MKIYKYIILVNDQTYWIEIIDLFSFFIIVMTQPQTLQQLFGVDVSEYGVFEISKETFIGLDLEKYPQNVAHLLIHALQFGYKIPSLKSMLRTQKRNLAKSLGTDRTVFRAKKVKSNKLRNAKKPKKAASRKRAPAFKHLVRSSSSESDSSVSKQSNFLHIPIDGKPKREQVKAFKTRSPEQIALKCARQIGMQQLKKFQAELKKKNKHVIVEEKVMPDYFIKRKSNQKRRRHERWKLIKQNKAALLQLYGSTIFTREFHMSRKEIQSVLSLPQSKKMEVQGVAQFMAMVDENEQGKDLKCQH